jgi:hypothetical protein
MPAAVHTVLHDHILAAADYYAVYERYRPDVATLKRVAASGLTPHVRIYYTATCGECARHLPALARVAEHLPGWTWELIEEGEARLKQAHCTLSTPVITVSEGGRLLGTISGNPAHGSLEADLLHIVAGAAGDGRGT